MNRKERCQPEEMKSCHQDTNAEETAASHARTHS